MTRLKFDTFYPKWSTGLCGIYKIKCKTTGKLYIGSSKNLKSRANEHFNALLNNKHYNVYMQRLFNKYNNFDYKVLILCKEEDLLFYEQILIDQLNPELNLSKIAGKIEMTDDVKEKLKKRWIDRRKIPISEETRLKLKSNHAHGKPMLGKKHTEEAKRKMRLSRTGKILSEETRKRQSESAKLLWKTKARKDSLRDISRDADGRFAGKI